MDNREKKKAKISASALEDNVGENKNLIFKVIDTEGLDANQLPPVRNT
jgi:hypothetical protein